MNDATGSARHQARQLAGTLASKGLLSRRWAEAFSAAPREEFLPAFYLSAHGEWNLISPETVGEHRWRDLVYQDVTWVQRLDGPGSLTGEPAASCLQPSLAAQLLGELPESAAARVCEIGSGSGWLTALLSCHYDAANIVAIELDHQLAAQARQALSRLGHAPDVIHADGYLGHPARAPYDAILSTASVTHVPEPWITQTRPGGTLITPFRGGIAVLRIERAHRATGRFLPEPVQILPLRSPQAPPLAGTSPDARPGPTEPAPSEEPLLRDPDYRFFLGLLHPELAVTDHGLLSDLVVTDPAGSTIRVTALGTTHINDGADVWNLLCNTQHLWNDAGRPGPAGIELELGNGTWWARAKTASAARRWQLQ
jgi:protein-L-isoaspartate O-methyltransferase